MDRLDLTSSDSEDDYPQKGKKGGKKKKSGRCRTTEDFVVRQIRWPHHGIYKGRERKPATFDTLSVTEFVHGYINNVLSEPSTDVSQCMLIHLRELMQDATDFPWANVRNYHGVVLGQMEQDQLSWEGKSAIQELRMQYAKIPATTPESSRAIRYCHSYQQGTCHQAADHISPRGESVKHICAYCFKYRGREHMHAEKDCVTKTFAKGEGKYQKNGYGGL